MQLKSTLFTAFTLLLLLLPATTWTQGRPIEISGTVIDNNSGQPIEFATVMVLSETTTEGVAGTTTAEDGTFTVSTTEENFSLEISFIGFQTLKLTDIAVADHKANLGIVQLAENSAVLDEVVVRAEKSSTEFRLDKRVFNVGKDLSSTGASALEVLNNVPSVNVNIEGEISLRGSSGVQILINGKPSVIASEQGGALGTITADMIDQIEVITNPSAKYEAEGTSGIINIVLKKEERKGLNGSVSLNTGSPQNHSFGLSLNRRTEKFNLFSQLGAGYREYPRVSETRNQDLINNTLVTTNGDGVKQETFYNLILGTDYHINKFNVLTLSGNFAYEIEKEPSIYRFSKFSGTDLISEWERIEATEATNPKWQYELQYKRNFADSKDHHLLFSALGRFFGKDQSSDFMDKTITGLDQDGFQKIRTDFGEAVYTFKLDYTKPFTEEITIETGAQYVQNDVSNDYEVQDLIDGDLVSNPNLTNIFEYDQEVLGAYVTGAYEGDKWGLKLGLRLENTNLNTLLTNTNTANQQKYTNLFPSVHTSYKLTENFSLQAGYSRRIYRPRLWNLNPFFNIRNSFSIRTGNPNLQPEFTDSYEITSIYVLGKTSLNFGVYHRFTTDVVERVSTFENNVSTSIPLNIGTNRSTGLEFNAKYTPNKWLAFTTDLNYSYFNRLGSLEDVSFDFNANQWSGKLTSKFKLPAKLDMEITGHYRSSYQTVQSVISDNLFADLGLRKKLFDGKGVISLSVRDIFASRVRESETSQANFYLYNFSQRGRFINLGFSYGFGKGEAMEFSGQHRRH